MREKYSKNQLRYYYIHKQIVSIHHIKLGHTHVCFLRSSKWSTASSWGNLNHFKRFFIKALSINCEIYSRHHIWILCIHDSVVVSIEELYIRSHNNHNIFVGPIISRITLPAPPTQRGRRSISLIILMKTTYLCLHPIYPACNLSSQRWSSINYLISRSARGCLLFVSRLGRLQGCDARPEMEPSGDDKVGGAGLQYLVRWGAISVIVYWFVRRNICL